MLLKVVSKNIVTHEKIINKNNYNMCVDEYTEKNSQHSDVALHVTYERQFFSLDHVYVSVCSHAYAQKPNK